MCIGIAQYQMNIDRAKKAVDTSQSKAFVYPSKEIKQLNPNSYHINLGKQAVIIPQQSPENPQLAVFGWTDKPDWSNRSFYCYNVRVEGSKSKGGNPNDEVDYNGDYKIKDNFLVKSIIKEQRCLIPCDFFVEQPHDKTDKRKFIVKREDESSFHLAGICKELIDRDTGETTYAFTILTTAQSKITAKIHHKRSPLVLQEEHLDFYLNQNTSLEQLEALYLPPSSDGFVAYEVDPIIAKKKIPFEPNNPILFEPISEVIRVEQ